LPLCIEIVIFTVTAMCCIAFIVSGWNTLYINCHLKTTTHKHAI